MWSIVELDIPQTSSVAEVDTSTIEPYGQWLTSEEEVIDTLTENKALIRITAIDSITTVKENAVSDTIAFTTDTIFSHGGDSLMEFKHKHDLVIDTIQYSTFVPDPNKVVWMALAFPGLGQIYNRKFWKLPIVYGGVAGVTYAITWNSRNYKDYSCAYRDLIDTNPETNSYLELIPNGYPESQWKNYLEGKQNASRRYRDLSIIIGVIFYAVTVVDAFVDASLAPFDVSPDLSMKVRPKLETQPNTYQPALGCAMQINF